MNLLKATLVNFTAKQAGAVAGAAGGTLAGSAFTAGYTASMANGTAAMAYGLSGGATILSGSALPVPVISALLFLGTPLGAGIAIVGLGLIGTAVGYKVAKTIADRF